MDHEIWRDLGAHDADIETLKQQVSGMRKDVTEIKEILNQAKGGWRVLMAVGGLAAAISSAVTTLVFKFMGAFK